LIVPQIAFIPGPHAVGAAAAPLDKDKDASAKTHPLQTVRAGKRIIKIRGSTGGRSFHEPAILSSKDGILESPGSSGFIDKNGTMVVPAQWERTGDFSEGLAAVKQTEKWGYIDKSGKMVIAPQFDDYRFGFSQGSSQKAHLHSLAHGRGKSCQDVQAKLEVVVFARR
jgi:hypothetical protein